MAAYQLASQPDLNSFNNPNQKVPETFFGERRLFHSTIPLTLRDKETGKVAQKELYWTFSDFSNFRKVGILSSMIAENPQLSTTLNYVAGKEGHEGFNIFTLSLNGKEVFSGKIQKNDCRQFESKLDNAINNITDQLHTENQHKLE
jgi:hypothetical protein